MTGPPFADEMVGAVEVRRGGTWEQFQGIHALGDAGDYDIGAPDAGVWGVRVYTRLRDARDGSSNDAFPATHYWASAGEPSFEELWWADGRHTSHGQGDTAGFHFSVRGVEGPAAYPDTGEWAWAFRGDWDEEY